MTTIAVIVLALVFFYYVGSRTTKAKDKKPASSAATRAAPPTDKDAWEGSFWEAATARSTKKQVHMVYRDALGVTSTRQVSIRSFEPEKVKGLFIGHCLLRNATRTFRYDRIQTCADMESGEIIDDLRAYLNQTYATSPPAMALKLVDAHMDLLRVMFYIAKADGSVRAAEVEVISALCQQASGDPAIDADVVNEARGRIDEMNVRGFAAACKRIYAANPQQ